MFSRAILAIDLSEASHQLIASLRGLAPWGTSEIILVHCTSRASLSFEGVREGFRESLREDAVKRMRSQMEQLCDQIKAQGFRSSWQLLAGAPGKALAEFSGRSGARLLIVGSRGASLAKNMLLGSSALEIVRAAPIPVLLKRVETPGQASERQLRFPCHNFGGHVLYATDFSPSAEQGFRFVENLVAATHGEATLLHVCREGTDPREAHEAWERLAEMRLLLEAAGARRVQIRIPTGDAAEEITRAATGPGTSLLVMGTHGKGTVEEFFLGSETQTVLRRASIPVLVIPPNLGAAAVPPLPALAATFQHL